MAFQGAVSKQVQKHRNACVSSVVAQGSTDTVQQSSWYIFNANLVSNKIFFSFQKRKMNKKFPIYLDMLANVLE